MAYTGPLNINTTNYTYSHSVMLPQPQFDKATFIRDLGAFLAAYTVPIFKSIARQIVVTASRFTPPGTGPKHQKPGNSAIDPDLYIMSIKDFGDTIDNVRNFYRQGHKKGDRYPKRNKFDYYLDEDMKKYAQGYRFKIISTKAGQPKKVKGYAKTLRTAKRMARIQNRGIAKYSWGSLLNNISGKVIRVAKRFQAQINNSTVTVHEAELPSTFRLLAQKSPNIRTKSFGAIVFEPTDITNVKWSMTGSNKAENITAWNNIAIRRGVAAGRRRWNGIINAHQSANTITMQKFLAFQINKVILKRK